MIELLFSVFLISAHAEYPTADDATQVINGVGAVNTRNQCNAWYQKTRLEKCQEKMKRIYKDGTAKVDLFMGYADVGGSPPLATDAIERAYLVQKLYRACGSEPCGFKADPKDANHLGKTFPDGRKISVNVHSSAIGDRDDLNRNNPAQASRTALMNEKFKKSLQNTEAVFYLGHSRDGGGPDFGPPRLTANGHTDYAWYRKNKPGLKMIEENMSNGKPEFYGSFSCDSMKHFAEPIRKANREVVYFGTTRLAYFYPTYKKVNGVTLPDRLTSSEVIDSALLAIGGMATQKCEFNKTFKNNNQPTVADYE
jgi:hypothetical protein